MNNDRTNPASNAPIDEADLLALVEGGHIPTERAEQLQIALESDPRLAHLVTLMLADREAVAAVETPAPPRDLLDRVEARLERDALVGLAHTEASAAKGPIPISKVLPPRRVLTIPRYAAPLAAAAAVALVAGGIFMMVPAQRTKGTSSAGNPPSPPSDRDLARNADQPALPKRDATSNPLKRDIAGIPESDRSIDAVTPPTATPAMIPDHVVAAAKASDAPTFSTDELLVAAREGRLMLCLRAASDHAVEGRVKAVSHNARSLTIEALDAESASSAARAYASGSVKPAELSPLLKPFPLPDLPSTASSIERASPLPRTFPVQLPPEELRSPVTFEPSPLMSSRAYYASLPSTAESLESLRTALNSETVIAQWRILPVSLHLAEPTDAASLLWWTTPPTQWTGRVAVPIVIQTN